MVDNFLVILGAEPSIKCLV